jgi:signal recognition particle receptor subunit beta
MVTINYAFREISCKIVYYGPGLSGKTTNLQYVHDRVPSKSRGDLISLATETDRTLYFDFLPIHVGDIAGFATKFQLYTVPGQVFYNATRKLVLRGVDGIVFVADSQTAKMDENIESLSNMYENLRENGIDVGDIPVVIQYNKRDLPDIAGIEELEKTLNPEGRVFVEASAVNGAGVFDTLKRITKLVLEQTKKRTSVATEAASPVPGQAEPVIAGAAAEAPSSSALSSSGKVHTAESELVRQAAPRGATAVAEATPAAALPAAPQSAPIKPIKEPQPAGDAAGAQSPAPPPVSTPVGVHAPQRSLRIRRKQRSFLSRLFGWLFGR